MNFIEKIIDSIRSKIGSWMERPEGNIWEGEQLYDGEWVEIQSRAEWYESPNVTGIYSSQGEIFGQMMELGSPEETYYSQNIDSGSFESKFHVTGDTPSGRGELKLSVDFETVSPPSGENDFAMVEYFVKTEMRYDMPSGITSLPRIIADPLNRLFKEAFENQIGDDMIKYDAEYARQRSEEYFQYLRKYHGEEPVQSKKTEAVFKPVPEQGVFFQ
ncbi:MAG: hypothetical protein ABEJ98_03440 [Candidatus Nanohaloarchaea archaeon]